MTMNTCFKFCRGGKNTERGLFAMGLSQEVITASMQNHTSLTRVSKKPSHRCPLGCVVCITDINKIEKLIESGMQKEKICTNRY